MTYTMKRERCLTSVLLIEVFCCWFTNASLGDRSYVFQKCLSNCFKQHCAGSNGVAHDKRLPMHLKFFNWNCKDECRHSCMWIAVDAFQKDKSPIPQFYGKWPFVRFLGMQEPASVLFSIMNALPHLIMLVTLRKRAPSRVPMFYIWHIYAAVAVHTWFWSAVYHSRDTHFTELMDYFGAIALNLFSVFVLLYRILGAQPIWRPAVCFSALLAFFIYHVHYLAFVKFDYGYNMRANVTVGLLMSALWLLFCHGQRRRRPYVWKAAATILGINLLLGFELGDFPPYLWVLDAHALWHAGTAPFGILWYSFVVDDCLYNAEQSEKKKGENSLKAE